MKVRKIKKKPLGILKINQPNTLSISAEEFMRMWNEQGMMWENRASIVSSAEPTFISFKSPKRARFLLYVKNKT